MVPTYDFNTDPMIICPRVGKCSSVGIEKLLRDNLLFYAAKDTPINFTVRKYLINDEPSYICTIEDRSVFALFDGPYAKLHIRSLTIDGLFSQIPLNLSSFVVINIEALNQAYAAKATAMEDMRQAGVDIYATPQSMEDALTQPKEENVA